MIQITDLKQHGFSLLETLIALAIMSIASLALFQSTATMLSVSDRAIKTSERALDNTLDRRAINGLLSTLVPSWLEDTERNFVGTPTGLRGLSAQSLSWQNQAVGSGMTHFALVLTAERGGAALRYRDLSAGDRQSQRDDEGWVLEGGLPESTRFSYLGIDGNWYAEWPPATAPATAYFNDALFVTMPSLPEAVKLQSSDGSVLAIVAVRAQSSLPVRVDLGRDNVP